MSKPFHESIVDAIGRTHQPSDLKTLGELIKDTKIVSNHDTISSTWKSQIDLIFHENDDYMGVPEYIAQQELAMHGAMT